MKCEIYVITDAFECSRFGVTKFNAKFPRLRLLKAFFTGRLSAGELRDRDMAIALRKVNSDLGITPAQEQPVENSPQQYFCSTCTQYLTVIEAMDTHNQSHDIVRVIPNSPQKGKP